MRVVVIGGTGHIGSYLTPRLVEAGYSVICVSRSMRGPYVENPAWSAVEQVTLDRNGEAFDSHIAALNAEAVIDLTCYTPASARQLVAALRGRVQHFLHCGTIWVHGVSIEVPTTEDRRRLPISDYGV